MEHEARVTLAILVRGKKTADRKYSEEGLINITQLYDLFRCSDFIMIGCHSLLIWMRVFFFSFVFAREREREGEVGGTVQVGGMKFTENGTKRRG